MVNLKEFYQKLGKYKGNKYKDQGLYLKIFVCSICKT